MLSYKQFTQDTGYSDTLLGVINSAAEELHLSDHLNGFDQNLNNMYFDQLLQNKDSRTIFSEYVVDERLRAKYPNLKFDLDGFLSGNFFNEFREFKPLETTKFRGTENTFSNFVCSFNGGPHPGRLLLVSILSKFGFLDESYCSKNFTFEKEELYDLLEGRKFQSIFFDASISNKIMSFSYTRFNHRLNHYLLTPKISKSFLNVVSETAATSYYPFVTEKFLYSVINHGLFLAYAQPGWHEYLEKYFGFKKYNKIFDYSFDNIQDPIDRLITLVTMISKFARLDTDEWNYLYHLEHEALTYNYNHYINGKYIQVLTGNKQL